MSAAALAPAARLAPTPVRARPSAYLRLAVAVLRPTPARWATTWRADWHLADGSALSAASTLTLLNLAAAVLIRQQTVLNVLFGVAGRGSKDWPLWLRWSVSKVHHVGGIHVGGALAGTAWLCAFTVLATIGDADGTTVALAYALAGLALVVSPARRPRAQPRAQRL